MKCDAVTFPTLLIAVLASMANSHRILVIPMAYHFSSHLLHMRRVVDILSEAGHDVTLLINNKAVEYHISEHASVVTYDVAEDVHKQMAEVHTSRKGKQFTTELRVKLLDLYGQFCDALLGDERLLYELKAAQFDLVFVDVYEKCGRIMQDYLGAPSILYETSGFTAESAVFYPQIPSFVCPIEVNFCRPNDMTFTERAINLLAVSYINYWAYPKVYRVFDTLIDKHKINTSDVRTATSRSIVLINSDFVVEYPRPLMPNVFYITGLFYTPPRPLSTELMQFVEDSAPHGVIVLSLGMDFSQFETQQAEMIASVFGRLKQKVIWRNTGRRPEALANNTMLTDWFPQNDVLAHPLTKVFITHCGIGGVYDAVYNAVPVVAVPLDFDQHYHAKQLVDRLGMGVKLDFKTFQEHDLQSALHEVLDNTSYLENAKAAAALLFDQPITPKQQLLNLFNYVIRHKGAKHLVSEAALELNVFQFYSLDILCAFISALCVTIAISVLAIRNLCRYCCGGATRRQKLD